VGTLLPALASSTSGVLQLRPVDGAVVMEPEGHLSSDESTLRALWQQCVVPRDAQGSDYYAGSKAPLNRRPLYRHANNSKRTDDRTAT
jgi:hypothetical protein